jgi:hypothetical protein
MYDSQEELDRVVKDMLSWLPESVDQRGLVAPWPGTDGQVWLTANAVSFLVEAREAGYTVDERFLGSLLTTLKRSIRSDYRYFLDYESLNERAAALLALTDAGTFEDAYFSELARMQRDMTYDGASWVLMAADRGGVGAESTAQQLAGNLADAITVQSYQGKEVYGGLTARRTERNPRILPGEATTLAHISRALYRTTPDEPRLALATDALVQLGKEDGWGTVSANAAALRALSERLEHSSKARFQVTQGARSDRLDLGDDRGVAAWSSADTAGLTVELASGASGVVLQTSRWTPSEHGDKEQAQATGFVVERGTLRIRAEGPPDKLEPKAGATMELFLGDVVEEHVRVVTPETRHYVAITVPLAAGLEPLNPALATSGPEATPTGQITREPSYATYYDDAVTLYYDTLPKGTYDLFFRTKATTTGSFVQPAATALMIDNPSVRGHSDGTRVLIAPGAD